MVISATAKYAMFLIIDSETGHLSHNRGDLHLQQSLKRQPAKFRSSNLARLSRPRPSRQCISDNPACWTEDPETPARRVSKDEET